MARNLAEMVSNGVTPEGDCVDAGEFWSAVELLDDALSLQPENALTHYYLGAALAMAASVGAPLG